MIDNDMVIRIGDEEFEVGGGIDIEFERGGTVTKFKDARLVSYDMSRGHETIYGNNRAVGFAVDPATDLTFDFVAPETITYEAEPEPEPEPEPEEGKIQVADDASIAGGWTFDTDFKPEPPDKVREEAKKAVVEAFKAHHERLEALDDPDDETVDAIVEELEADPTDSTDDRSTSDVLAHGAEEPDTNADPPNVFELGLND